MEIKGEKAVMVPASTMGLLLAMASNTKWKTENSAWLIAAVTSHVNDPDAVKELLAYIAAFCILETQARGEDAKKLVDITKKTYGDEMLEKVFKKIEVIETIRKRRNKK
ncbi:hypothetical protein [Ligilactobacillus ruminis]|uniref:Uncharacterized protein n=2 Tax=Ligilactobacillus ruminis TaxID=1623 RepID=A0A837IT13_9LACO|nr:hypothetical protein [Ligilactobacillus ruminis]KLA46991.1 hypothetical protein LRB_433 [Ligilactobacillus ruminis]KRM82825.1 hypothetical protein FC25_GL000410 [Ligilactobacillus ruminis DSM 20403 = NBRC 102161]SFG41491.1 hypothetical protein SAMN02910432_01273 [Ligilactobacillus ruminis DSM 20403 = NBRC 102161]